MRETHIEELKDIKEGETLKNCHEVDTNFLFLNNISIPKSKASQRAQNAKLAFYIKEIV